MELGEAKKRCQDIIERIERLPSSTNNITSSCKRTLLKLATSELNFLSRADSLTLSVNIGHLEAVLHILQQPFITGVSRVCKPIPLSSLSSSTKDVHVDIVSTLNGNPVWIIVSDRNPNYITFVDTTNPAKGLRFRIQQLIAAAHSAVALKPSSLILFFSKGLGQSDVSDRLRHEFGATEIHLGIPSIDSTLMDEPGDWINVLVSRTYQEACVFEIKVYDDDDDARDAVLSSQVDVKDSYLMAAQCESLEERKQVFPAFSSLISNLQMVLLDVKKTKTGKLRSLLGECDLVNFDTTALIAIVSSISNGGTEKLLATPESELRQRFKGNYEFVIRQVMSEIQNPILVEIGRAISGKRGIICESVHSEFKKLVLMVGGPNEKFRASHLLNNLTVVPDSPSTRMMSLPTTRKLALKCKIVFGTGDHWCCPTVTANMAFVRAVSQAGMSLFTIEHRPRALTGD